MIRNISSISDLIVRNESTLREYAVALRGSHLAAAPIPVLLLAALINPADGPEVCGFRVLSSTKAFRVASATSDARFRVHIDVEITCPDKLLDCSIARYATCWGDQSWIPTYPDDAVFEILIASNANPSPSDIGVELIGVAPEHRCAPQVTHGARDGVAVVAQH